MYRFYSSPHDTNRVSVVGQYAGGVLKMAAARCSSKDHFVRKIGRAIAEGRLRKDRCTTLLLDRPPTVSEFCQYAKGFAKDIQGDPSIINKL